MTKEEQLEQITQNILNRPARGTNATHVNAVHTPSHRMKMAGIERHNPQAIAKGKEIIVKHIVKNGGTMRGEKHGVGKVATALAEHLTGVTQRECEEKYKLSNGYLNLMLKKMFPNTEAMEKCLEEVLLSNAIICGAVLREKAPEMSGKDAAIATGIMSQRFLEVKKARQNNFREDTPSIAILLQLQSTMEKVGQIIDIDESGTPMLPPPSEMPEVQDRSDD